VSRLESDRRGPAPRHLVRGVLGATIVTAMLAAVPATAAAVPPPPPNPSDSQLGSASADASSKAGEVAGLVNQLNVAQGALDQLTSAVALKKELANKARVDLGTAQQAAAAAATAQVSAQQQVTVAQRRIDDARRQVDQFAAGSYQQGSTVGSFSAYVGSASPEDVLARAQLLDAVSSSQLGVMDTLQRARTQSANADSEARAAKQRADTANAAATRAKQSADGATSAAVQAQQTQAAQSQQLALNRNKAQYAVDQARGAVAGLQGQRQAFEQWDAQRRAEEAAAARAAAEEAAREQAAAEAAVRQQQAEAAARQEQAAAAARQEQAAAAARQEQAAAAARQEQAAAAARQEQAAAAARQEQADAAAAEARAAAAEAEAAAAGRLQEARAAAAERQQQAEAAASAARRASAAAERQQQAEAAASAARRASAAAERQQQAEAAASAARRASAAAERQQQAEAAASAARRAAEAAASAPAPRAPSYTPPAPSGDGGGSSATGDPQTVINRALSRLGARYSWGGGNYNGPTVGVRDGGIADSYGDYYSVGFDCSGLMMYAFAAAGIYLPHFSGYQYTSGTQVPLSRMQPGDMIFYGDGGSEHVALYMGNGKMIEAPESGEVVKVSPVRYGGIAPYVTRMF
jgi:cell wall-associated NlpC family hydrolase